MRMTHEPETFHLCCDCGWTEREYDLPPEVADESYAEFRCPKCNSKLLFWKAQRPNVKYKL